METKPRTFGILMDKIEAGEQAHTMDCDSVCSTYNAYQPSYDDFAAVNIKTLTQLCQSKNHCEFSVQVDFDYENNDWKWENGSTIHDLVWINSDYPVYNDILVFYLGGRHRREARFLPETSSRKRLRTYKAPFDLGYHRYHVSFLS